jgi:hypothetical protein
MTANKHFFRDRTPLLMVSFTTFLTLGITLLVALKLYAMRGTVNYTVAYRDKDVVGLDSFITGTAWDFISLIVAAWLFLLLGGALAYRSYQIRRELSLTVLYLTSVMLIFLSIVCWLLLAKQ